jgi:hypothetical protein
VAAKNGQDVKMNRYAAPQLGQSDGEKWIYDSLSDQNITVKMVIRKMEMRQKAKKRH